MISTLNYYERCFIITVVYHKVYLLTLYNFQTCNQRKEIHHAVKPFQFNKVIIVRFTMFKRSKEDTTNLRAKSSILNMTAK